MSSLERTPTNKKNPLGTAVDLLQEGQPLYKIEEASSLIHLEGLREKGNENIENRFDTDREENKSILHLLEETVNDLKYETSPTLEKYKKMIQDIDAELSIKAGSVGQNGHMMISGTADSILKQTIIKAKYLNIQIAERAKELLGGEGESVKKLSDKEVSMFRDFFDKYKESKTTM